MVDIVSMIAFAVVIIGSWSSGELYATKCCAVAEHVMGVFTVFISVV